MKNDNDQEKDDDILTPSSHKQHIDAFFVYHLDTLIDATFIQAVQVQHIHALFVYISVVISSMETIGDQPRGQAQSPVHAERADVRDPVNLPGQQEGQRQGR